MPSEQGSLDLLNHPVAQELLRSTNPARLAYVWRDGTPRVVPIWFHWTGEALVFGTPVEAPKMEVIPHKADVAVTIDDNAWPYKVLLIRGAADVEVVDGIVPEYAAAARRYFGEEQGNAWVKQVRALALQMARIAVRPTWVGVLDFQTRFPSAIETAIASQQSVNSQPTSSA